MTNHQGCFTYHCSFFNASNDSAVLQITSALDWNIMSTTIHLEISHAFFVSLFLCLKKKFNRSEENNELFRFFIQCACVNAIYFMLECTCTYPYGSQKL